MSLFRRRLLPAALVALASVGAQATTLTFDELAHLNSYRLVSNYTAGGYVISNGTNPIDLGVWGATSARQADFGGATLFNNYAYTTTTLKHVNGDVFEFCSIDIADVYNQARSFSVDFTFTFSDGAQLTETVTHDSTSGLERFTFNIPDLSDGIGFVPVLTGLFAVAELLEQSTRLDEKIERHPLTAAKLAEDVLWPLAQKMGALGETTG